LSLHLNNSVITIPATSRLVKAINSGDQGLSKGEGWKRGVHRVAWKSCCSVCKPVRLAGHQRKTWFYGRCTNPPAFSPTAILFLDTARTAVCPLFSTRKEAFHEPLHQHSPVSDSPTSSRSDG